MFKLCIFKKAILIPPMVLILFLLSHSPGFAEDNGISILNDNYFVDSLLLNQGDKGEYWKHAFIEDNAFLGITGEYSVDLLAANQNSQDGFETTSSKNSLNTPSHHVDLGSAHKYLGYATAVMAGITAVSFSSDSFHRIAGYTTAGLSLITTGIGFYEYGEYLDLDEGFSGYNLHMILETAATIGFLATAALQGEDGVHAALGGVSTAMMILPIFIVQW
jgi:hypothetical protein